MINFTRYAAIDIGSNAVRLLLASLHQDDNEIIVKKMSWVRMPIRLGEDAFAKGYISADKEVALLESIKGFSHLIKAFAPKDYMACATSAMRTAQNGGDICSKISAQSGVKIELIDGATEAKILFQNKHQLLNSPTRSVLFIDVGGGSSELSLFFQGTLAASRSFPIGTIRLLQNEVTKKSWDELSYWVQGLAQKFGKIEAIGSGGNINKLFKLAAGSKTEAISRQLLGEKITELADLSVDERIIRYNFKPDRADVIVHGGKIYQQIMEWAGCETIHVPMFGLADGMVRLLHQKNCG